MIVSLPDSAKNLPLSLNMFGINHKQEPINRPIGLPVFQWFYCVRGKGKFISDHQCSVVTAGQGLLIYPNVSHVYQSLTPDWTVHFIGFQGSICSELLQSLSMESSGVYYLSRPDIFEHVIIKFNTILHAAKPDREIMFSASCYQFLLELSENINYIHPSELVRENQILQMILSYLGKNVSEISKMCGFESPSYFGSIFRKTTGTTPDSYRKSV